MARYERLAFPHDFSDPKAYITVAGALEGLVLAARPGGRVGAVAVRPGLAEAFDVELEDAAGRLPHEPGYRAFQVIDGGPDAVPVVPLRRRTKRAA